jgi:hypothetical protein
MGTGYAVNMGTGYAVKTGTGYAIPNFTGNIPLFLRGLSHIVFRIFAIISLRKLGIA